MKKDKRKFELLGQDYNSPFIRNYIWLKDFYLYPKLLGIPSPALATVSRKNSIDYLAVISSWEKTHLALKQKVTKDFSVLENLVNTTEAFCIRMNQWTEKNIFKKNLTKLSNKKLFELLQKFFSWESRAYAWGVTLPVLDFHGFSFIENSLKHYLKSVVSGSEFEKYYSVFTEPAYNSFSQDQEESLLKLVSKFYGSKKWRQDVQQMNFENLKSKHRAFAQALSRHAKKFAWVYYVYNGPAYTENDFVDFIRDYLNRKIIPQVQLKNFAQKQIKLKQLKQAFIKKHRPGQFDLKLLQFAGKFVWAKPRRKDYQSKSYYHSEKLFLEVGRRLALSYNQVKSMTPAMLQAALVKGKAVDSTSINSIFELSVCRANQDGTIAVWHGKKAREFIKNNVAYKTTAQGIKNARQVKGECACPGKVVGLVKIVNSTADMAKMDYGNILVSVATSPAIVAAMKKSAAIVTEEGGLTCHASIVSRELNIPCVIGTKIATKVLKDGDRVEVDATLGIVKKV